VPEMLEQMDLKVPKVHKDLELKLETQARLIQAALVIQDRPQVQQTQLLQKCIHIKLFQ
jgi:hypothetical protein